ncbi:MAG TPA: hypothetical protein VKA50_02900 [Gammaproteobacteria bacterium]|nr:hypothetical protein [Gammaproteobacteria bacterium]
MVFLSILLFGLAALFGLGLVVMGVRYHRGSLTLGLGHAGIAMLALIVLAVHIFTTRINMLYDNAALLFVLTLGGGVVLLALRDGRKSPPMVVVGIHALMALAGLAVLVVGYVRS